MNFLRGSRARTNFSCTRFGNVLGSRGSVVPLFARQIAEGGPVTLTDKRMTRFVMSMSQSANLVIESMELAKGGEIFVTKMPVLKIPDLARVMIDRLAPSYGHDPRSIEIKVVGPRPGEKMWEELSTEEESARLLEGERFLAVLPPGHIPSQREAKYVYEGVEMQPSDAVYNSDRQPLMSDDEIGEMIMDRSVLPSETVAVLERTGALSPR